MRKKASSRQNLSPWSLDHEAHAVPLCHNLCPSIRYLLTLNSYWSGDLIGTDCLPWLVWSNWHNWITWYNSFISCNSYTMRTECRHVTIKTLTSANYYIRCAWELCHSTVVVSISKFRFAVISALSKPSFKFMLASLLKCSCSVLWHKR